MSLQHALLISLLEKPASGYELARRFDKSIGYFWHATHQQIYRELARMEAQGWVKSYDVDGGRAGKRQFEVLPPGQEELKNWAGSATGPVEMRDELLLKLRADAVLGPLGLEHAIAQRLALHQERLAAYKAIEARDFSGPNPPREVQIRHVILKAGIALEQSRVAWATDALATLLACQPDASKPINIDLA